MRYALKSIVAGAVFACACCFARQVLAGEAHAKRPGPIPDVAVEAGDLQWAPGGRVEWSDIQLAQTTPPPPRKVRLAAVHYKPTGRSPRENREEFAPLLAEAGRQKTDLVVLGETVPSGDDWMISAVFDREGTPIARAGKWGTVAVAEVDLSRPTVGPYNLGDFRSMVPRHRPVAVPE